MKWLFRIFKKKRMKGLPLNSSNDAIRDYVGQRNLASLKRMGQKEAYLSGHTKIPDGHRGDPMKMAQDFADKVDKEMRGVKK